jgi:hypothetical protein
MALGQTVWPLPPSEGGVRVFGVFWGDKGEWGYLGQSPPANGQIWAAFLSSPSI